MLVCRSAHHVGRQGCTSSSSFYSSPSSVYDTRVLNPVTFERAQPQGAWDKLWSQRSWAPLGPLQGLGLAHRMPHWLEQRGSQGSPPQVKGTHQRVAQFSGHRFQRQVPLALPGKVAYQAFQRTPMEWNSLPGL